MQDQPSLSDEMLEQSLAMSKHALSSGIAVPNDVLQTVEDLHSNRDSAAAEPVARLQQLAHAHQVLTQLVSPSTPRAITLFAKESAKSRWLRLFGPVPLVRWLLLLSILLLAMLVLLSMTEATNLTLPDGTPQEWSIFNSSGIELLWRLLFVVSAAGLGACFAALFLVNQHIVDGTYDPKFAISYWIRIVLGPIAGVILSEIVPLATSSLSAMAKPVLALLGGFSAATLFRILNRIVQSVESIVQGDTREAARTQQRAVQALANERLAEDRGRILAEKSRPQTTEQQQQQPNGEQAPGK